MKPIKLKTHIFLFIYLVLLCFALLKPFDFHFTNNNYSNNVNWLQTKYGIHFNHRGQIISEDSTPELYQMLTKGDGLTIEVWISTYNIFQDGPARIFSYSMDPYYRNFTLGQSKDSLVMRLRTELTDPNGVKPHIKIAGIFEPQKIYHIIITYNFYNECVFINGKKRICDSSVKGNFSNWDPSFKLVIGNEVTGDRPWLGEIYYAAIYNEALSSKEILLRYQSRIVNRVSSNINQINNGKIPLVCYLFNEKEGNKVIDSGLNPPKINLHIPEKLISKRPLFDTQLRNLQYNFITKDNVLNVLGFIPLGLLLHRIIKFRFKIGFQAVIVVLILGGSISLGCEVLQHFLLSRNSSIIDVCTNVFGLSFGIAIEKITPDF